MTAAPIHDQKTLRAPDETKQDNVANHTLQHVPIDINNNHKFAQSNTCMHGILKWPLLFPNSGSVMYGFSFQFLITFSVPVCVCVCAS